ncbi:universal stress protein [Nocardioides aurantiacus]|uniref:Nucleotide-binding universal stress UspA family protein n=1 Tax=Nocardioides aurantiacus TaxID=86796 RepID=A0A3N2CTJ4_9ACTN|nr:universal stress protein [Nocardioides aurantiacus]ROR90853.1 nucleotide-binding universal stress UspA family protein [Nocardioides aurantiacus]
MMDIEPHKVLVCVSPGEDCTASLELAAAEARRRGCGVHLAVAVGPLWVGPTGDVDVHLVEGEWRRIGAEFLHECGRRVTELLDATATVSTEIAHGPVVGALVGVSEHAALVVLQHHRMGRTHAVPTLSVTNGVASRAHAPVVAVPDGWGEDPAPSDVVVVGVEDPVSSAQVVRHAFEQARLVGGRVRLVQAWFWSPAFDVDAFGSQVERAQSSALAAQLRHGFADLVAEFEQVPHEVVVVHGRPADVLVAQSHDVGRVVVGRHEPTLPWGSHLGPVTRAVLNHASCPVVVVDPVGRDAAVPRPLGTTPSSRGGHGPGRRAT